MELLISQLQTLLQDEGTSDSSHRVMQLYSKHRVPLPGSFDCLVAVVRFSRSVAEQLRLALRMVELKHGVVTVSDLVRVCDDPDTLATTKAHQEISPDPFLMCSVCVSV